jgi:hypothetical protein
MTSLHAKANPVHVPCEHIGIPCGPVQVCFSTSAKGLPVPESGIEIGYKLSDYLYEDSQYWEEVIILLIFSMYQ